MKFIFKKSNKKPNYRKKLAILLILLLVIVPSVNANASVFDPLVRLFLPLYEKIAGKDTDTDKTTDKAADQNTEIQDNTPTHAKKPPPPPFSPSHTATPDLMTIMLAEFAYDRGDPNTALTLYKSQALKDDAAAVFERALEISMQYDTAEESLAFSRQWQAKNPDHTPAWFYTTHLALKVEDYATVSQNLKQILEYDPKVDLGQIFEGIFPESPAALQELFYELQALDNDDNASLAVLKAGLLVRLNETDSALLYLDNALKTDPNNLAYYLLKADILKNQHSNALIDFLTQSEKITTDNTQKQLYTYHARYLIDKGDLAGAWRILKPTYTKFQGDFAFGILTALVALDMEEYKVAAEILTALTQNSPAPSEAYYYLGISYERMGEYKSALKAYRQVSDMNYVLTATQKQVALELAFGNADNAINALIKLRQNFEMYASDSYTLQADILVRLNKKDEAKQLLKDAYQQYPDDFDLLYALSKLLDNKEEFDEKTKLLQELIADEPDKMAYRLDLAQVTLSKNPDDEPSLALATTVSQTSEYGSQLQLQALEMLANHALSVKDYRAVVEYLQTPYELSPNLSAGVLLVRAYQGLGDGAMVQKLLVDLQARFGQNNPTSH